MLTFKRQLLLVGVLFLAACASPVFRGQVKDLGDIDALEEAAQRESDVEFPQASKVMVLHGNRLDPGRYRRISAVESEPLFNGAFVFASSAGEARFFYPYRESWRKWLCWPQAPLLLPTFNIWAFLPPYWACDVSYLPDREEIRGRPSQNTPRAISERREWIIRALKQTAVAMGGDTLLIQKWEDVDTQGRTWISIGAKAVVFDDLERSTGYEDQFPIVFVGQPSSESTLIEGGGPARTPIAPATTVALMDLRAGPQVPAPLVRTVSDLLQIELVNSSAFTVIDRGNLHQVLREQALQQSGVTEISGAVEIGRLLTAQKIIVGSVSRVAGKYYIALQLIDVQGGRVDRAATGIANGEVALASGVEQAVRQLSRR